MLPHPVQHSLLSTTLATLSLPAAKDLPTSTRGRIKDVEAFFRHPDYDVSFRSWLRQLLEDLFVIDAPSLFCQRSRGGLLTGLQIVDGG